MSASLPRLAAAALTALAVAPSAVAQVPATTTTPTTTPAPPAATTPAPAPKRGTLTLRTQHDAALVKTRVKVRGTVQPFVAGQEIVVRFYRGSKKVRVVSVKLRRDGKVGRFTVGYASPKTGRLVVRAVHRQTSQLDTLRSKALSVSVLPRSVGAGSHPRAIRILQHRLHKLGYVIGQRGVFDSRTARAVVAFRKVTGMRRSASADEAVFAALAKGAGRFRVKFPKHGRHVEADISRQVLALIGASGKVERIYPTSTGAPATPTILGSFRVYRKDFGTNAKGMVHASYFIRGYAIHGYQSVPVYNASHGCLRVPVPDAASIFRWVRYGTRVDTYR